MEERDVERWSEGVRVEGGSVKFVCLPHHPAAAVFRAVLNFIIPLLNPSA